MKRLEKWMVKGASVLANGKEGTIVSMTTNKLNGIDYVYYIRIKLNGSSYASPYYPTDVEPK